VSTRVHAWRDKYRRYVHTGAGSLTIDPGETCIVIVGRDLDAAVLKALGVEVVVLNTEPPK